MTERVNPIESVLDQARQSPGTLAVASADFVMTYGDLASSLVRFASRFRQLGIGRGSVVAVSAQPAIEAVVTLALMHEGATSLSGTSGVLRAYASNIDVVITDGPVTNAGGMRLVTIDSDFLVSLGGVPTAIEPMPLTGDEQCRIVFSSGTTGTPKGVPFTVDMLLARTTAAHTNWMPAEPFMSLLGLDTASGILTFYWSAFHGKTYFLVFDAQRNRIVIERYGVRSIKSSPARLANLLDVVENSQAIALDAVEVAGSLLTPSLGKRIEEAFGCTPIYLYGSTEGGTATVGLFDSQRPHVVGRLTAGVEFELVDAAGQPVTTTGAEGIIRYRCAIMPSHYWLDESNFASAFRDGWFYPGDLGSLSANGELHISGRSTDVVNASGAKFNLAELDVWLSELRIFTDAASFSFTTDAGVEVGVAFVAKAHVGAKIAVEQLRSRIPNLEVKILLKIDAIPRNQFGKVDRPALVALIPSTAR